VGLNLARGGSSGELGTDELGRDVSQGSGGQHQEERKPPTTGHKVFVERGNDLHMEARSEPWKMAAQAKANPVGNMLGKPTPTCQVVTGLLGQESLCPRGGK
jgi:hypothetical protein